MNNVAVSKVAFSQNGGFLLKLYQSCNIAIKEITQNIHIRLLEIFLETHLEYPVA